MRLLKIMPITLVLCVVSILSSSCASEAEQAYEGQAVTVQRGDLRIDITGVGNLALSNKVDLAFEMDGTVQEILAQEAQSVEEGQVLAKLDNSAWEEQVTALEDNVIAAERNLTAKERAVTDAERKVADAERNVTSKERAVTTAERQVTSKELDLLQAQINLNNAKLSLEQTQETSTDRLEIEVKELQVKIAEQRLVDAQIALEDAATEGLEDAQLAVENAKVDLEDAQITVEDAQIEVADAKKALEDARKALDEAKNASPAVTAPFAGFITKVSVAGGDEVKKGTVAVNLADPNKFEADILVSEVNIPQVNLGGEATVQVNAISGLSLPAKVTHISPTATIQSGVVNYQVKVELQSMEALMQAQQAARPAPMQGTENITRPELPAQGELPERLKQAIEEGRMTQEEAEEMMGRMGQMQPSQGWQQRQTPTMALQDFQLREGMTGIVSITVDERNDVLLVPNSAITSRGRQTYVRVLSADGTTQERAITAGINDSQYTEVIDGLSEGEQVIIPLGASATTTAPTTQQQRPPQPGGIQGIQRMLR